MSLEMHLRNILNSKIYYWGKHFDLAFIYENGDRGKVLNVGTTSIEERSRIGGEEDNVETKPRVMR